MRTTLSAMLLMFALLPGRSVLADSPDKTPEQEAFEDALVEALPSAGAGKSDGNEDGKLGSGRMKRANKAAAKVVKRRMEKTRANDLMLLRQAGAADVVIVSGSYDRAQDVMKAMEVKHVVIPPRLVGKLDLMATQTLLVNCPGNVSKDAIANIRDFVSRGGYLITTDWALKQIVQKAFPKTVKHNGVNTKDDVVKVHVHDHNEPLLAHVKVMGDNPRWWLEGSSYPIKVIDNKKVSVLMSSPEMKKKYGQGAVVVSFDHGDGKVLHMTSHFFLQQSKLVAAAERKKASSITAKAGLSTQEVKDIEESSGVKFDDITVGELNSAYSMQQFSTNLLVSKQKANKSLLKKKYRRRMTAGAGLATRAGDKADKSAKKVRKDFKVEVLDEKSGQLKVRDLFGNEGWVSKELVE